MSKYEFCPRAANIQLNFTSLSNLALNMEHSVCKVSLAHHTKEWLSALFEALDGLELSVNNYLFTLLWIACRNKCLSHHLYQCSPPSSLHITTYYGAQNEGTGNGDTICDHIWRFSAIFCGWGRPVSCQNSGFWSWLFPQLQEMKRAAQTAQLQGESTSCNRCYLGL